MSHPLRNSFVRILAGFLAALVAFIASPALAADGVDTSPLPLKTVRSFPQLKPRRPVAITHANDGSKRLFLLSEFGQVLIVPNDQEATETTTFLDIEEKVDYQEKENEEGLLGLAFHPKCAQARLLRLKSIVRHWDDSLDRASAILLEAASTIFGYPDRLLIPRRNPGWHFCIDRRNLLGADKLSHR